MGSRILLADDSITIQKVVNLTFADEGIEVVSVSNGDQAEKRLGEVNPDLVLADIFMPGRNGYELCEFIKQSPQYKNIPVVLLVGAFEPFDQGEARRVQADGHLTKPFESRTLVETVRGLIERSAKPRTGALGSSAAPDRQEPVAQPDPTPAPPVAEPAASPFAFDLAGAAESSAQQFVQPEPEPVLETFTDAQALDLDYAQSEPLHLDQPPAVPPTRELHNHYAFTGQPVEALEASFEAPSMDALPPQMESVPEPVAETPSLDFSVSTPAPGFNSGSSGVPSAFGYGSEDVVLDFEKAETPAPEPPSMSPVMSFEVEQPVSTAESSQASYDTTRLSTATAVEEPLGDLLTSDVEAGSSEAPLAIESDLSESPLADLAPDLSVSEAPVELPEPSMAVPAPEVSFAEVESLTAPSQEPPFEAPSFEAPAAPAEADFAVIEAEPSAAAATESWHNESPEDGGFAVLTNNVVEPPVQEEIGFAPPVSFVEEPVVEVAQPVSEATAPVEAVEEPSVPEAVQEVASAEPVAAAPAPSSVPVGSEEMINEIVRRVTAEISDKVIREIAWEVVPDCVERVIDRLTRESLAKRQ